MERRTGVELPVAIIAAIVVLGGVGALMPGGDDPIDPWVVFLAAVPYVLSALCILQPRLRRIGLGIASGGAALVTVAATPLAMLVSFYVAPLVDAGAREAVTAVVMFAQVPLHAALAFTAVRRLRAIASGGRLVVMVGVGVVIAAVYGMAVRVVADVRHSQDSAARARVREAEYPGGKVFDDLVQCIRRHETSPNVEWPATVDGLGPAGLNCLETERLRSPDGRFALHWATPMRRTSLPVFTACVAEPKDTGGWSAKLLDEGTRDVLRESFDGATADSACAAAYHRRETLPALRYCLWRHAAEHASYPSALAEVAACAAPRQDAALRFTYAPGPPDADGRIAAFVLIEAHTTFQPGEPALRLDESGAIRGTYDLRLPVDTDPIVRPGGPETTPQVSSRPYRFSYDGLRGANGAAAAMQACMSNQFQACAPAARLIAEVETATPQQQARLLERGCEAGDATSCFSLAQLAIRGQLPAMPPARGEQLRLIACSTAPVPEGCAQP